VEARQKLSVTERLEDAIGTGEIVRIIYHGGSHPGSSREIAPIAIDGTKVRARCYDSNAVKEFKIDKIELVSAPPTQPIEAIAYNDAAPPSPIWTTLQELASVITPELEAAGWHVTYVPGDESQAIELRTRAKSGQVRKHPAAGIRYERMAYDAIATPEGTIELQNPRPRTRPWAVHSKERTTTSYSTLDRAVAVFLSAIGLR
jgi:hypothetical protein